MQKSIMGVSIKDIPNHRDSLIMARTPRKIQEPVRKLKDEKPKIFEEFFIIGINKNTISAHLLEKEVPLEPENLYMFNH